MARGRRHVRVLGLLGLSVTGLTWSARAGANIGELRAALDWGSPSVTTTLDHAAGDGRPEPATATGRVPMPLTPS